MNDEQRLRDLLRAGLPAAEPPGDLWDRSRGRLHRARARQRIAGALAALLVVVAVGVTTARVLPGAQEPGVQLDTSPQVVPASPSASPSPTPSPSPSPSPPPSPAPSAAPTPTPDPAPRASATPTALAEVPPAPATAAPCTDADPLPGAEPRAVPDLDGDGARDRVAVLGAQVQVTTSGGRVLAPFVTYDDAAVTGVGVADAEGDGQAELFVRSPGRAGERVTLAQVTGCRVRVVQNAQGVPYAFDVGERDDALVGVGCVRRGGEQVLVGLRGTLVGDRYEVERTAVDIRRDPARNGATDTVDVDAADPAAVGLIRSATCGESLLDDAAFP